MQTRVSLTIRYFYVFYPNDSLPSFQVPEDEARHLIRNGHAKSINRGKAIRLNFKPKAVLVRGESCKMGERVMIGNADGIPYFRSLVEGWRPALA
jgi:hypothetical protein